MYTVQDQSRYRIKTCTGSEQVQDQKRYRIRADTGSAQILYRIRTGTGAAISK